MFQQLLTHYEQQGLFACRREAGEARWSLTAGGSDRLLVGQVLRNARQVIARRADVDPKDMSVYELLTILDQEGWDCQVVGKLGRRDALRSPYKTCERGTNHDHRAL